MSTLQHADQVGSSSSTSLHDRLRHSVAVRSQSPDGSGDEHPSDSEIFDELERELDDEFVAGGPMSRLREARWTELKCQIAEVQARRDTPAGKGIVSEISSERELIQLLGEKGGELAEGGMPILVHFYHKEFRRCEIMGQHLDNLASLHPETMIIKISVLDSPFLVEKLGIKVLPELVAFGRRAQVKDRIIGFEDLGNSDNFSTKTLEWRLAQGGAFAESGNLSSRPVIGFTQSSTASTVDEDGLDWD